MLSVDVSKNSGFTLIELVIVIVVIAVLSGMTIHIITWPVKSYIDLSRRATLANNVDNALRRMQRDIRQALPNSIRIAAGGRLIELLHTTEGGRYRRRLSFAGTGDVLQISPLSDSSMDVIGAMQKTPSGKLVINNTGSLGANDAYAGDNITTISSYSDSPPNLGFSGKQFPEHSTLQNFFVVDGPVSYYCDLVNRQLLRYEGYPSSTVQPNPPASSGHLLVNQVSACAFSYDSDASLVSLTISLTDSEGESVHLLHQVHVDNGS